MANIRIDRERENNTFREAWAQSYRSECLKKKVGAVLLDTVTMNIVGRGYGGAVVPCERCVRKEYEWQQDGCWSVHSEMRAVFDAIDTGHKDFSRSVMFVTHGPCDACIKLCHFMGIPLIIYDEEYHNDYSKWKGKIKIQKRGELHEFDLP